MKAGSLQKLQRPLVIVFLGVTGLLLLLCGKTVWYEAQQDRIGTELTPEGVIRVFQGAGIETGDLTDNVEDFADYYGEYGMAFTSTIESETYHVLVVLHIDWREAKRIARAVNGLNESMKGGHASAFHYGPIFVEVYPSNERITDKLQTILKESE